MATFEFLFKPEDMAAVVAKLATEAAIKGVPLEV